MVTIKGIYGSLYTEVNEEVRSLVMNTLPAYIKSIIDT